MSDWHSNKTATDEKRPRNEWKFRNKDEGKSDKEFCGRRETLIGRATLAVHAESQRMTLFRDPGKLLRTNATFSLRLAGFLRPTGKRC